MIGTTHEIIVSAFKVILYDGFVSVAVVVDPVAYVPVLTKKSFNYTAFVANDPVYTVES